MKGFEAVQQSLSSSTNSTSLQCQQSSNTRRVWTLSTKEFDNSIAAVFGDNTKPAKNFFPKDTRVNGFTQNPSSESIDSTLALSYLNAAESVAANIVGAESNYISSTLGCTPSANPSATVTDACISKYITARGLNLFRRPVTAAEISDLYQIYLSGRAYVDSGQSATAAGIQLLASAMIQMPQFYYRTEMGDLADSFSNPVALTQYEIATALAYLTTSSPPDATLLSLASQGALSSSVAISAQYQRLVVTAAGRSQIAGILMEWLDADQVDLYSTTSGPLTAEIAKDMDLETRNYLGDVIFTANGSLSDILQGRFSYLTSSLAAYYGLSTTGLSSVSQKVNFPANSTRQGLLSQGSFLVPNSQTAHMPLLNRGLAIRTKILCGALPTFESLGLGGFTPTPLQDVQGESVRTQLTHAIQGNCYSCHQFFQPLGYPLEQFNSFGQYQTVERGAAIDVSGEVITANSNDPANGQILTTTSVKSQTFADLNGMVTLVGQDTQANACFAKQIKSYLSGRNDVKLNECGVQPTPNQKLSVQDQIRNYITSSEFMWRNR